jgi:hypothetical protein
VTTYTPTQHHIWNELDEFGLLLDLPRLDEEANRSYKQRLFDVFVNRASSTYRGLINGVTRELGLDVYHAMTVTPVWHGDGFRGPNPAIVFDETKCYVYADYVNEPAVATIDRFEKTDSWTMQELVESINATEYMYASLQSGVLSSTRAMEIFNQKSIELVISEDLDKGGPVVNLDHSSILSDSVTISSTNLRERVSSQEALIKKGQYYIDYSIGVIYTVEAPEPGAVIRYQYRNDNFEVWASPVIIHSLQSSDFKGKMFEQILTDDGTYTNGAPTELGADLVNELLSKYPLSFQP